MADTQKTVDNVGMIANASNIEANDSKMTKDAWKAVIFVVMAWIAVSLSNGVFSVNMPTIIKEFHLSLTEIGIVNSLFLGGGALGAIFLPMLADKKGRRIGMVVCISLASVFSSAIFFVQGIVQLACARILTGCGISAEWPIGAAHLSESVPAKKRGLAMGIQQMGSPISTFLGAWIVMSLAAMGIDWRIGFAVMIIPILLCIPIMTTLQESSRWLENREIISLGKEKSAEVKKVSFSELFKPQYRKYTIMAAVLHICGGVWAQGNGLWFPTVMQIDFHVDKVMSAQLVMLMWGVGILGYLLAGRISDKIGRKITMTIFVGFCIASVLSFFYYRSLPAVPFYFIQVSTATLGFGLGAHSVLIAYSSEIFPSHVRAVGIGLAIAAGRVGAMVSQTFLGMIGQNFSVLAILLTVGIFYCMMLPIIWSGPETAGRKLEDIVN